jgi:hypothetical protein
MRPMVAAIGEKMETWAMDSAGGHWRLVDRDGTPVWPEGHWEQVAARDVPREVVEATAGRPDEEVVLADSE